MSVQWICRGCRMQLRSAILKQQLRSLSTTRIRDEQADNEYASKQKRLFLTRNIGIIAHIDAVSVES